MKKTHKASDRVYSLIGIIYEDDENFDNQMFNLMLENEVLYARHDKDIWLEDVYEDDGTTIKYHSGDLKKPHVHYVVKFKNPCTLTAFAKRIQVQPNSVEYVDKSLNSCITYLIHFRLDDKYQYDASIVESNSNAFLNRFLKLVNEEVSEVDKVESIESFLDGINDYIDMKILGKHVRKINSWDAFRRNYSYFRDIVNSHNAKISSQLYNMNNPYWDSDYTSSSKGSDVYKDY